MSDSKKYKKLKKKYKFINEQLDELYGVISSAMDTNRRMEEEMEYLSDFVAWKSLEDEYIHFRKNAFKDPNDELPFPRYIL